MALHDRAYMRRAGRPAPGGMRSATVRLLLVLAAGVFVHEAARGWFRFPLREWTALSWDALRAGRVWTALTYPLADRVSWNLLFGGVAIWMLGTIAEAWLGAARFALFAVLATLAGAALHAAAFATGAGAAVAEDFAAGVGPLATACVAFAALREPSYPVNLFPFAVPLWVLAVAWTGYVAGAALGFVEGGANVWAHAGAAAYGAACWRFRLVPEVRPPRPRAPREREREREEADPDDIRARVDVLLDKIGREGMAALTEAEKRFLNEASKRYR